ncbi:MAG: hypothetical protein JNJ71_17115 [Rubrivivax sp.]|nr:hypothetical protein [Rubrivivax sp.]
MLALQVQTKPQVLFPAGAVAALLFLAFGWGPNMALVGFAVLVLFMGILLLWRPGEPPVMLLIFALQWLQASTKAINANLQGLPINSFSTFGGNVELSSYLSLLGLLLFALGMNWGSGAWRPELHQHNRYRALSTASHIWFAYYALALMVSVVAEALAGAIPGLSQPLLALAHLRWAFYFMLTFAAFSQPWNTRHFWLIAALIEFAMGIGGYFSDFKSVFLYSALGITAAGVRLSLARIATLAVAIGLTIYTALLWTAVKGDYRHYVSGGEAAQIVTVDYVERISYLGNLVSKVDGPVMSDAVDKLLSRLAYVEFFGAAIDYVPRNIDHTRGEIWWDAVKRPFMPRVLFPSKSEIHDSERTAIFTGIEVSGADRGTSISIGYMGESYIDFGFVGMMAPVLVLGYLLGRIYRWLTLSSSLRGLLGTGLACSSLMAFSYMESSITKVFGGFVATLLVIWVFSWMIAPRYLGWLLIREEAAQPVAAPRAPAHLG